MTKNISEPHLFDAEKYRAHIAPLELSREQEDALLHELWTIAETLVDQSFSTAIYPYQFTVAANAFNAVNDAVAIESEDHKTSQTTKTQEEL